MKHKIHLLSDDLHLRILGRKPYKPSQSEVKKMYHGYKNAGLDDAEDRSEPLEIPVPAEVGSLRDVIRESIAMSGLNEYLENVLMMINANISKPLVRVPVKSGWQMYNGRRWVESSHPPNGSTMIADFETVKYTQGQWFPTMLVCTTSENTWYVWQWSSYHNVEQTVSIGTDQTIIGHNIPYDRSYFREEYLQEPSGNRFFDTMAAWIAVRGMSNQQRPMYNLRTQAPWTRETTTNGLSAVHAFYTGKKVYKTFRDAMVRMSPEEVMQVMPEGLAYCLEDVFATWEVLRYVFPEWKLSQSHDISRCGQMLLGNVWLPISERFKTYPTKAQAKYDEVMGEILRGITDAYNVFCAEYSEVAEGKLIFHIPDEIPQHLSHLDWTPAKSGRTKGYPKWYRETKIDEITIHSRIVPTILGIKYRGEFVYWEEHPKLKTEKKNPREGWRTETAFLENIEDKTKTVSYLFSDELKSIVEDGTLTTNDENFKDLLFRIISCVNWVSLRKRVVSIRAECLEGFLVVVPSICVNGTASGRCADPIWQCSPNSKATRIGTELRSMIEPPDGFVIVGADVDGEESWIASLMADVAIGYCGASTFGLTMLVGSKKYKTDIHSVIAAMAGIGRGLAKNIFYGMLYGLSLKGVTEYIQKSNANMSAAEVSQIAALLIRQVKGIKIDGKWYDGLGSDAFNFMERLANSKAPRSDVLQSAMTRALAGNKDFATSRVNWTIQTAGVDFRDALITFIPYFAKIIGVEMRLIMSIHDEFRYMVREEDAMKAAHVMQLAHLYVRALFIEAFGLDGIPQACAYFSGVDIDKYWRKASVPEWKTENGVTYDEANAACVTPSQDALPYGKVLEPIDIFKGVSL